MTPSSSAGALVAAALFAIATPALAHVTFETPRAAPNSTYKGVLRIPHGCDGQPTKAVRLRLPEGMIDVKPMPKAGWVLETVRAPYARTYQLQGRPVSEGVTEIIWTGSLDDGHYDEFVFQARITDAFAAGATIYFPVVQTCPNGSEEWTQIPAAGQDPHSLTSPAPGVTLVAAPTASAAAVKAGALTIEQPWSRATPPGARVGGGYLRITNAGGEPDRLVGASFPLAGRVELHEMSLDGTVMRMKPVEGGVEIRPGATVDFKPGGYHLMFMDLKEPLTAGRTVKGTLVFEKAGTVAVDYAVQPLGAQGPAEHVHH
jgi:periplasmic copper chaperone A